MENTKCSLFIFFFKLSNFFTKSFFLKVIGLPIRFFYKLFIQWVLGIDIPDSTIIGKNFIIYHGQGLVVNKFTRIGDNVVLRHNTTIGNSVPDGGAPTLGNGVSVGANSVIIGDIYIGNNSIIGAGSVVVKDVPANVVVAGNPAKVIKRIN